MYYLSFDVATKSLAFSFIRYNINWKKDINIEYSKLENNEINAIQFLENVNVILNNSLQYLYGNVIDLIPGKKIKDVNIFEKSKYLKEHLNKINNNICEILNISNLEIIKDELQILIEYQMSHNYNSNAIYNQIIYEYTPLKIDKVIPTCKNKIYLHNNLIYQNFIEKYANNYTANKNHTKANFIFFLEQYKITNLKHIKKRI